MADHRTVAITVVTFSAVATAPLDGLATAAFAGVLWVTGGLPLPITVDRDDVQRID